MRFTKLEPVKTPEQAEGDAGIDFFIPENFPITPLDPGGNVLIPSGIRVVVPVDHVLIAFNKSGVATKKNLQVGACVVDSSYRGEVHIHMTNVGKSRVTLYPKDKIVQFVLLPYVHSEMMQITNKIYDKEYKNTDRGSGGFGSTDK